MAQLATSYYHARRMAAGADYSHPKGGNVVFDRKISFLGTRKQAIISGKKAHIPKWAQQVRSTIAKRVRGAAPKKKWDRLNSGTVRLEVGRDGSWVPFLRMLHPLKAVFDVLISPKQNCLFRNSILFKFY